MKYCNSECCFTPDSADIYAEKANRSSYMDCDKTDNRKMQNKYTDRDDWYNDNCDKNDCDKCTENDLMNRMTELKFVAIDLNLFLDTHPYDKEALEMFKKIAKTLESMKADYIRKYGPIMAWDSSENTPFQWASTEFKWPWEK